MKRTSFISLLILKQLQFLDTSLPFHQLPFLLVLVFLPILPPWSLISLFSPEFCCWVHPSHFLRSSGPLLRAGLICSSVGRRLTSQEKLPELCAYSFHRRQTKPELFSAIWAHTMCFKNYIIFLVEWNHISDICILWCLVSMSYFQTKLKNLLGYYK